MDCWRGIVDYMNNAPGAARDGWHGNITSWFYWSWNPDSIGAPHASADTCCTHLKQRLLQRNHHLLTCNDRDSCHSCT